MDSSFRPVFRWGSIALWLIGLLIAFVLNGRSANITHRPALAVVAILTGSFAAFVASLLFSERVRRVVLLDEPAFSSRRVQWGWALVTLTVIAAGALFKIA